MERSLASRVSRISLTDLVRLREQTSHNLTKVMLWKFFYLAAFLPAFFPMKSIGQTALDPGEHNVVLNGVRLWYEVAGEKPRGDAPVIYLHGGPGYNSYSFKQTIGPRLERHALMIYLDQRGCGHSERPWTNNYAISTLVDDVEALRKSLGVTKISLLGHSFGGAIALEYASRYPNKVQNLIVVDGAADLPTTLVLWRTEIEQRYPDAWASAFSGDKQKNYQQASKNGDICAITKALFAVEKDALAKVDSQSFHNWQQFHDQRYQKERADLDAGSVTPANLAGPALVPRASFFATNSRRTTGSPCRS